MLTLDVEQDTVLDQADVLALSETWVDEPVPIQGFNALPTTTDLGKKKQRSCNLEE